MKNVLLLLTLLVISQSAMAHGKPPLVQKDTQSCVRAHKKAVCDGWLFTFYDGNRIFVLDEKADDAAALWAPNLPDAQEIAIKKAQSR